MNNSLLFPRLPPPAARRRMAQIAGQSAAHLSALASSKSDDAIYPATGGTRVTGEKLDSLRTRVIEQARILGFSTGRKVDPARFDWEMGPLLLDALDMHAGEACRTDVWSFITLQLLPDLATWRFPNQNERRLLGGVRNTFQRLWWRAFLLRDPHNQDVWHLLRLPEDALVGLFERPGISSNPHVTRAIATEVERLVRTTLPGRGEESWRLVYKLIRQRVPLVNLDALGSAELHNQLQAICIRASTELSR